MNFFMKKELLMKGFFNNKWLRAPIKVLLVLIVFVLMLLAGCYGLGKIILHANKCEAFMIDNTEVHTHINIPEIDSIDCNYQPKAKRKRVYFVINKSKEPMRAYISFSEFKQLSALGGIKPYDFFRYNQDTFRQQVSKRSLFYKEHCYADGEHYKALLDTSTGQVWINIKFVQ
jgi:hypothetical protein